VKAASVAKVASCLMLFLLCHDKSNSPPLTRRFACRRLSLMQEKQLEQSDRDLHRDVSNERARDFRNLFGLCL